MDTAHYAMLGEPDMRSRKQIELDGTRKDFLQLEVLLDIRELLIKATKKSLRADSKRSTKNSV